MSQRDAEIEKLKSRIDAMQETLAHRENEMETKYQAPKDKPTISIPAPAARDSSETRELRDHLRRLKDNLKVEHDERNRAMRDLRDLRAAQDQLRRAAREKPGNPAPDSSSSHQPDVEVGDTIGIEWEPQVLRIPEYSATFRESLRNHPRQASAAAITAVDLNLKPSLTAYQHRSHRLRSFIGIPPAQAFSCIRS